MSRMHHFMHETIQNDQNASVSYHSHAAPTRKCRHTNKSRNVIIDDPSLYFLWNGLTNLKVSFWNVTQHWHFPKSFLHFFVVFWTLFFWWRKISKTKNRTCKCRHQRKLMNNFRLLNAVGSSEVEWKSGLNGTVFDAAQCDGFLALSSRDTNDMFK